MSETELAAVRNQQIGFVFQQFNLLPSLSALRNVELPLCYAGIRARTNGASGRCERWTGSGSPTGSTTARRALRRSAATGRDRPGAGHEPALILADEPTGNLDSHSTDEVMACSTS